MEGYDRLINEDISTNKDAARNRKGILRVSKLINVVSIFLEKQLVHKDFVNFFIPRSGFFLKDISIAPRMREGSNFFSA